MPSMETWGTFFGLAVLLALSPGPDNLFVLMQSVQRGPRVGFAVVQGLCLGIGLHTLAVAAGLAAVVAASPMLFQLMKWCGALYLVYLAWGAWRAPVHATDAAEASAASGPSATSAGRAAAPAPAPVQAGLSWDAWRRMVGRGMVMNLTNPKVLIFFLALLPQFADPARGTVPLQIMALGLAFMLATLLVFGAVAYFSGVFGVLLQRSAAAQRWLNRAAAVVFVGLAVRLALVQK